MAEYGYNDDDSPPGYDDDEYYGSLIGAVRRQPTLATPTQGTQPRRVLTAQEALGRINAGMYPEMGTALPPAPPGQYVPPTPPGSMLPQATAAARGPQAPTGATGQPWHDKAYDELIKAADAYSKQPDMTAAIQANRRASSAASDDIASGMLLSALGGDEFAPMAGAVLKQAIAARSPQEIPGGWGSIQNGVFTPNPYKQREAEVARLEARAKFFEQRAQHADSLDEKRYAAELAAEARAEATQARLAADRQRSADRDERQGESRRNANARLEDAMGKAYETQVKEYRTELDATRKVAQLAPTMIGRRPNSIEQQSMIVLLNKFLDPGSVVREGEFDRVVRAMGYIDRASNLRNRLLRGELMSDRLIGDIVDMAKFYEKAATAKVNFIGDQYYEKAAKRELDPTNIVIDPYYVPRELREQTRTQPAGTQSNPLRAPRPAAPAAPPASGNPIIDSRPPADPNAPRRNIVNVDY